VEVEVEVEARGEDWWRLVELLDKRERRGSRAGEGEGVKLMAVRRSRGGRARKRKTTKRKKPRRRRIFGSGLGRLKIFSELPPDNSDELEDDSRRSSFRSPAPSSDCPPSKHERDEIEKVVAVISKRCKRMGRYGRYGERREPDIRVEIE